MWGQQPGRVWADRAGQGQGQWGGQYLGEHPTGIGLEPVGDLLPSLTGLTDPPFQQILHGGGDTDGP